MKKKFFIVSILCMLLLPFLHMFSQTRKVTAQELPLSVVDVENMNDGHGATTGYKLYQVFRTNNAGRLLYIDFCGLQNRVPEFIGIIKGSSRDLNNEWLTYDINPTGNRCDIEHQPDARRSVEYRADFTNQNIILESNQRHTISFHNTSSYMFLWANYRQYPDGYISDPNIGWPNWDFMFRVSVEKANNPPVIGTLGGQEVDEGEELTFTVTASDSDGDELSYLALNLPEGATFDPDSQVFSWIPNYTQSGVYEEIHFEVTDGELVDSENITITVENIPAADLRIEVSDSKDPARKNSFMVYTVVVTNNGPDTAENVVVENTFADEIRYVRGLSPKSTRNVCGRQTGNKLGCNLGNIESGASYTLKIRVFVRKKAEDTIDFKSYVGSDIFDQNTSDNEEVEETVIVGKKVKKKCKRFYRIFNKFFRI